MKVSVGPCSLRYSREESFLASVSSFWWLWQSFVFLACRYKLICTNWYYYTVFFFNMFLWHISFWLIFLNVELALHIRNKSHWGVVYDCFCTLLGFNCKYLIEDFCVFVHEGYWSIIFFSYILVLVSGQSVLASKNELGNVPPLFSRRDNVELVGF